MVMFRTVAGLSLLAVAAACGGTNEQTVYRDAEGNSAVVTTDKADPDAGEIRIKGPDGEMVINTGKSAALPFGLQIMPGSEVISSLSASGTGSDDGGGVGEGGGEGAGAMVSTTTAAAPAAALAFYRRQIEAKGMKIESEMTMNGMQMIGGKSGDEGGFQIMALPGEGDTAGKTIVNIMVGNGGASAGL